ncbi:MAG: RDD family protein, partial [Pirellulaceae bacterium]
SQNTRLANFIIDSILIYMLSFAVGIVVAVVAIAGGADIQSPGFAVWDLVAQVLALLVIVAYFVVMEAATGRTLGKLITGTKVVNAQGRAPTLGQIVGRSFARMIPFEPFSYFGKEPRGWHDTLSKTYVVKAR